MTSRHDDADPELPGAGVHAQAFTRESLDLARAYERVVLRHGRAQATQAALAAKRARGERIGTLPYGYRLAADGLHVLADDAEQAVLENVRRLAREGLSQRAIVAHLRTRGIVGRKGTPLQQTQVARMLQRAG